MEGAVTGLIFHEGKAHLGEAPRLILALACGSLVMVTGYLAAESLIYGLASALTEVPGNIFQVVSAAW